MAHYEFYICTSVGVEPPLVILQMTAHTSQLLDHFLIKVVITDKDKNLFWYMESSRLFAREFLDKMEDTHVLG